jgi:dCTP diphosphatase
MSASISQLTEQILRFRNDRNWKPFHNPKDCAISLMLEAAELLEHVQWKNEEQFRAHLNENQELIADELCDVLYWVLLMAHDLEIDLVKELPRKLEKNKKKYPAPQESSQG